VFERESVILVVEGFEEITRKRRRGMEIVEGWEQDLRKARPVRDQLKSSHRA
jgi:hypothetical protein